MHGNKNCGDHGTYSYLLIASFGLFVSGDWYCYWAPSYSVQSSHDFGCNLYITLCYCALSLLPHIPLHHHYYDHTTNLFQNRNNTSPKNYEVEIPGVYYVALALGIVCLILDIWFIYIVWAYWQ